MHVQSCHFANQTYCCFAVLVAVAVVVSQAPYYQDNLSLYNRQRIPIHIVKSEIKYLGQFAIYANQSDQEVLLVPCLCC